MAHTRFGYLFLRRGELDQAISHFEKALEIRSSHALAQYDLGGALIENNLATALVRKGLLQEAIDHFEKAAKRQPDYGAVYLNRATILFKQRRTDEPTPMWRKAASTQQRDGVFDTIMQNAC